MPNREHQSSRRCWPSFRPPFRLFVSVSSEPPLPNWPSGRRRSSPATRRPSRISPPRSPCFAVWPNQNDGRPEMLPKPAENRSRPNFFRNSIRRLPSAICPCRRAEENSALASETGRCHRFSEIQGLRVALIPVAPERPIMFVMFDYRYNTNSDMLEHVCSVR